VEFVGVDPDEDAVDADVGREDGSAESERAGPRVPTNAGPDVDAGNEVGADLILEDGGAEGNLDKSRVSDNVGLEKGTGDEVTTDGSRSSVSARVAFSRA